MIHEKRRSEVQYLLQQIADECRAAESGLSGLASGVARHQVINQKLQRIVDLQQELQQHVGEQAADMVCKVLDQSLSSYPTSGLWAREIGE